VDVEHRRLGDDLEGTKPRRIESSMFGVCVLCAVAILLFAIMSLAQANPARPQLPSMQNQAAPAQFERGLEYEQANAELKKGTVLTRQGSFADAIPHLLAARGHGANQYAASFNLALCYVGIRQYGQAVEVLDGLRKGGHSNADVENLLAQAYVGSGQSQSALDSLQRASVLTPTNERLYMFVADACVDQRDYAVGLKVVDLGLTKLPESAWLHYERGVFLSLLDEFDRATEDFHAVGKLAPGSEISYLAAAHEAFYAGNPMEAARAARVGVNKGFGSSALLTFLGEALLRSGARPGEPEFAEAQAALEKAISAQPRDANAHTSLGKLYLLSNRPADAIAHLEKARELAPGNPSVYVLLAKAYRRHGDTQLAQQALAILVKLNQMQAEKIASAPGDRRASYSGATMEQSGATDQH
jgi:tetratricopeptide (TPR) repeat protein